MKAANGGSTLDVDIDSTIEKKRKERDGDLATMWTNSSHSMAERKEQQVESMTVFLAMDNVPTKIVESKYFRAMLKSLGANADPPSINKVKDHFRVLEANIRQAQLVTTTGGFASANPPNNVQSLLNNRRTWTPIMGNRLLVWLSMLSHDGGLLTLCVNG